MAAVAGHGVGQLRGRHLARRLHARPLRQPGQGVAAQHAHHAQVLQDRSCAATARRRPRCCRRRSRAVRRRRTPPASAQLLGDDERGTALLHDGGAVDAADQGGDRFRPQLLEVAAGPSCLRRPSSWPVSKSMKRSMILSSWSSSSEVSCGRLGASGFGLRGAVVGGAGRRTGRRQARRSEALASSAAPNQLRRRTFEEDAGGDGLRQISRSVALSERADAPRSRQGWSVQSYPTSRAGDRQSLNPSRSCRSASALLGNPDSARMRSTSRITASMTSALMPRCGTRPRRPRR